MAHLAPSSDVVIIVDVLSFSTSVDIAVSRDAMVFPYRVPVVVDVLLRDGERLQDVGLTVEQRQSH